MVKSDEAGLGSLRLGRRPHCQRQCGSASLRKVGTGPLPAIKPNCLCDLKSRFLMGREMILEELAVCERLLSRPRDRICAFCASAVDCGYSFGGAAPNVLIVFVATASPILLIIPVMSALAIKLTTTNTSAALLTCECSALDKSLASSLKAA
jgi:hypothetical protein